MSSHEADPVHATPPRRVLAMMPREALLALWTGSSLEPCALAHRSAVTITGIGCRLAHDLGLDYTETEIRAALAAEGILVSDSGRIAKVYATVWTSRARGACATLRGTGRSAGR